MDTLILGVGGLITNLHVEYYEPSHCWYYLLGGVDLTISQIEHNVIQEYEKNPDAFMIRYELPKKVKDIKKLSEEIDKEHQQNIKRYIEVRSKPFDGFHFGSGTPKEKFLDLCVSKSLTHNHVCWSTIRKLIIKKKYGKDF